MSARATLEFGAPGPSAPCCAHRTSLWSRGVGPEAKWDRANQRRSILKTLSEQLSELSVRAKKIEGSVAAAQEEDRKKLEAQRNAPTVSSPKEHAKSSMESARAALDAQRA